MTIRTTRTTSRSPILRRLRRPLRPPRPDPLPHRGRLASSPSDGEWEVTVEDGAATGRRTATAPSWSPTATTGTRAGPSRPSRARTGLTGEQMHVHHYREPDVLRGKRVLVSGIGNSATDIAVESSRIADATFLAMRRGAYVMPKYLNGKPTDESASPVLTRLPLPVQRFFSRADAWADRGRHDRLRPAEARPQAARGASDGLRRAALRASATATSGSSRTSSASPGAARCGSSMAARRRSTSSSTAPATRSPFPSSTAT